MVPTDKFKTGNIRMYEMEKELVQVTDQLAQTGLKGFLEGNANELVRLRDELTALLEQAAQ
ncbi:hypothetical protein M3P21_08800 [Ruegeria sp. 2012CJ41-6]|uniref:Uncharacterized protein n=1 Tax=Ruegeria spongiae TaxID=2942209 RepID=A0ABT0Q172_9RHOB|nr:hypothetical protein [Ruegeria spongiae]MCL6283628.1 hypothetical protein [Ruegeria spongiae]